MFTSDNFNKYPQAEELLEAMIAGEDRSPFFVQCDAQVVRQERLVELLARAGCYQMFVGVESFDREALLEAHKAQNHPELYRDIVGSCAGMGSAHFSNILGFPTDTTASIREHIEKLRAAARSGLVLYPDADPGDGALRRIALAGLIYERNLDRFDATCETWHHDHFRKGERRRLLFNSYRRFYSFRQLLKTELRSRSTNRGLFAARIVAGVGLCLFSQYLVPRHSSDVGRGMARQPRQCGGLSGSAQKAVWIRPGSLAPESATLRARDGF